MASTMNGGKRQALGTTRHTRRFPIDLPISQRLWRKLFMSRPFKSQCPSFVPNMVAYPIVFTDIDQNIHISFQKGAYVVLAGVVFVQVICKIDANFVSAWGKVAGYRFVDPKLGADFRTVEVSWDLPDSIFLLGKTVTIFVKKKTLLCDWIAQSLWDFTVAIPAYIVWIPVCSRYQKKMVKGLW